MRRKIKKVALYSLPFLALSLGLYLWYFWAFHWVSPATLSLRTTLGGVTEVRVRVGCMSSDSGSSQRIVLKMQGAKARQFIDDLKVYYRPRTITAPLACNHYVFECYQGKTLIAEVGYFPKSLIVKQGVSTHFDWGDGHNDSSGRTLTFGAKRKLAQLLEPYEHVREYEQIHKQFN